MPPRRSVLLLLLMPIMLPVQASAQGWGRTSDATRDVVVAASLVVPAAHQDWRGVVQDGESLALAGATTYVLKHVVAEERPDASDRMSFPSGHTSISFAAATSLTRRYGFGVGAPALLLATVTGVARVEAHRHYAHDVLAGAIIGAVSALLLTSRHNGEQPRDGAGRPPVQPVASLSIRF